MSTSYAELYLPLRARAHAELEAEFFARTKAAEISRVHETAAGVALQA